jgi:hypothetical protein
VVGQAADRAVEQTVEQAVEQAAEPTAERAVERRCFAPYPAGNRTSPGCDLLQPRVIWKLFGRVS